MTLQPKSGPTSTPSITLSTSTVTSVRCSRKNFISSGAILTDRSTTNFTNTLFPVRPGNWCNLHSTPTCLHLANNPSSLPLTALSFFSTVVSMFQLCSSTMMPSCWNRILGYHSQSTTASHLVSKWPVLFVTTDSLFLEGKSLQKRRPCCWMSCMR